MSAPISAQLHNLTQSLNVLDASVSPDEKIPLLEFLNAVDSLLAVFGMRLLLQSFILVKMLT